MTESGSVLDGIIFHGEPLVSVNVITFNHGKYVRDCLDGILMQKVNFPYEVLIHDDASPDNTQDIIREYEAKYPDIIKPIYQTENQYSKGIDVSRINLNRAKGKYIAQCEGDDYWTDPGKLQMQVDFLEEHEDYVECGHNITVMTEKGIDKYHPASIAPERDCSLDDVIAGRLWGVATASAIYRNIFANLDERISNLYYSNKANGDSKISVLLSNYGKCHVFAERMSVYRYITSSGTSYNALAKGKNLQKFRYESYFGLEKFMKDAFGITVDFKCIFTEITVSAIISFFRCLPVKNNDNLNITLFVIKNYIKRFGLKSYLGVIFYHTPEYLIRGAVRVIQRHT